MHYRIDDRGDLMLDLGPRLDVSVAAQSHLLAQNRMLRKLVQLKDEQIARLEDTIVELRGTAKTDAF